MEDFSLNIENDNGKESGLYKTQQFRMYCFKVLPCSKRFCHDWTNCPFAHPGEKARRRDPRIYNYTGIACPDMKMEKACTRGTECPFAHNVFEYWLHPNRYRTQPCNDGVSCSRKICFFAHTLEELRVPSENNCNNSEVENNMKNFIEVKSIYEDDPSSWDDYLTIENFERKMSKETDLKSSLDDKPYSKNIDLDSSVLAIIKSFKSAPYSELQETKPNETSNTNLLTNYPFVSSRYTIKPKKQGSCFKLEANDKTNCFCLADSKDIIDDNECKSNFLKGQSVSKIHSEYNSCSLINTGKLKSDAYDKCSIDCSIVSPFLFASQFDSFKYNS